LIRRSLDFHSIVPRSVPQEDSSCQGPVHAGTGRQVHTAGQHNLSQYSDPPIIGSLQEFRRNYPPASLLRLRRSNQNCGLVRLVPGNMWFLCGERLDSAGSSNICRSNCRSHDSVFFFDTCRMSFVRKVISHWNHVAEADWCLIEATKSLKVLGTTLLALVVQSGRNLCLDVRMTCHVNEIESLWSYG
jgi:hypothetical protein